MSAPFYTTDESQYLLRSGVYITEKTPPAIVQGVNNSAISVAGQCVKGPVDKAILIGSEQQFNEIFGGRTTPAGAQSSSAMYRFMMGKVLGPIWVTRAAAAAAVKATLTLSSSTPTAVLRVDALSPGTHGNEITCQCTTASNGVSTAFDLVITYGARTVRYRNLDISGSNNNIASVVPYSDSNLVSLTKLANGTPVVSAAANLASGSEGTLASTDFTGTGRALDVAAVVKGAGVVTTAERMDATIKSKLVTLSGNYADRLFLIGPDSSSVDRAAAVTDAATYRADNVLYAFNDSYAFVPDTGEQITVSAVSYAAATLAQLAANQHPGNADTKRFNRSSTGLVFPALTRADYIALQAAGISAYEDDGGISLDCAVSTFLADGTGREQITRRRETNYLQASLAAALKFYLKAEANEDWEASVIGAASGFLGDLQTRKVMVKSFSVALTATENEKALGLQRVRAVVRLIGFANSIVLEHTIGTTATP